MSSDFRARIMTLRSPGSQYAFALLLLAAATLIRLWLTPVLEDRLPYMFYFVAVAIVGLTCDLYPALAELAGSTVLANLLFLTPENNFTFSRSLVFGSLFLFCGSVVIYAGQTHRRASQAFQEQKEWLRTTLTSIGDAVIVTDPDGLITLMNPVAEDLTGWKFKEAVDRPLSDVYRIANPDIDAVAETPVEKVRRLNRVVGLANHALISKDGWQIAIDETDAPIRDTEGNLAGIVLIFRDVTRQRALEAAMKSNERLALAGRLYASIAHEIHNPLDAVGSALFLLNQEVGEQPRAKRLIQTAQREVQRVTEISRNMLSLHRGSQTASRLRLSELLEGVVALVEETIAKGRRKIELVNGFSGEVEAVPSELRQVFTNVIKNAVEATSEGGSIKICSEAAQQSGQNGVVVCVVDDGVGIPKPLRARLFNPFVTTKEESGTGLGLWVSRSIVEKYGGSIRLDGSRRGSNSGTTVTIFLPLEPITRKDDRPEPHGEGTGTAEQEA